MIKRGGEERQNRLPPGQHAGNKGAQNCWSEEKRRERGRERGVQRMEVCTCRSNHITLRCECVSGQKPLGVRAWLYYSLLQTSVTNKQNKNRDIRRARLEARFSFNLFAAFLLYGARWEVRRLSSRPSSLKGGLSAGHWTLLATTAVVRHSCRLR